MLTCFFSKTAKTIIPITVIERSQAKTFLSKQSAATKKWLENTGFLEPHHFHSVVPDAQGAIKNVIMIVDSFSDIWSFGQLSTILPEGFYRLEKINAENKLMVYMAWALGAYQFSKYKKQKELKAKLELSKENQFANTIAEAIYFVRDLVNTPAEDMGPEILSREARKLASHYGAKITEIIGNDLLKKNYPAIHAVGRASDEAPRLIDIRWGNPKHRKVTLVGKGVCFDSGGLDLKNSAGMLYMRKDMAGAAHALGLAKLIFEEKLPIYLRVLIPAVENSVSGSAYHPGDIIRTRKGLTIEIGNTDAEGRVIMCDALAEADSENPEVLIDFSTLTGAARVAVGTDISALFSNNDKVAKGIMSYSEKMHDPIWQLPLYKPYEKLIETPFADINNSGGSYAGAITAALFLNKFVSPETPWVHFDMMAWNLSSRPGRPEGGEAMSIRAVFAFLADLR